MESFFNRQAELCKIFANDKRLEIINLLKNAELSTGELIKKTGLSKVTMSQHLNILKSAGVVIPRRNGTQLFYRLSNPKIAQACNLMREVLVELLQEKEKTFSMLIKASKKNGER
jgi:ArsR family transcriptional regulator